MILGIVREYPWTRDGLFYKSTYVETDGERTLTVVRRLNFIAYHLIKWKHGRSTLIEMANRRNVRLGDLE